MHEAHAEMYARGTRAMLIMGPTTTAILASK
jgi:hypothetical protein